MMRIGVLCLVVLFLGDAAASNAQVPAGEEGLERSIEAFSSRYVLRSLYASAVDDHGRGNSELRGVRNFRAVLPGILYRSGANNSYRALYGKPKLPNNGPLPEEGLANLCRQEFSKAYYLYGAAETKAVSKSCDIGSSRNTLSYGALHPQYSEAAQLKFLTDVHGR